MSDTPENDAINEITPEQQELNDQAAFEEGFGVESTEQQTVTVSETKPEESEPQPEESVTEPAAEEEPEAPILAGLTETQVKEVFSRMSEIDNIKQAIGALKESQDKAFGKFGEYNNKLIELQNSAGSNGNLVLKVEQLKRLHEYEPELAEMLVQDLQEISQPMEAPSFDEQSMQTLIDEKVNQKAASIQLENERRFLEYVHPDVYDVIRTPDFGTWAAAQDAETRQKLQSSGSAKELSQVLTQFKDWREQSIQDKQQKNKRLESAVLPTGDTTNQQSQAVSDEEAFLAGFENA